MLKYTILLAWFSVILIRGMEHNKNVSIECSDGFLELNTSQHDLIKEYMCPFFDQPSEQDMPLFLDVRSQHLSVLLDHLKLFQYNIDELKDVVGAMSLHESIDSMLSAEKLGVDVLLSHYTSACAQKIAKANIINKPDRKSVALTKIMHANPYLRAQIAALMVLHKEPLIEALAKKCVKEITIDRSPFLFSWRPVDIEYISALSLSNDGLLLGLGLDSNQKNIIKLYSFIDQKWVEFRSFLEDFLTRSTKIESVCFSDDKTLLAVGRSSLERPAQISLWDIDTAKKIDTFELPNTPLLDSVILSKHNNSIIVKWNNNVWIYDRRSKFIREQKNKYLFMDSRFFSEYVENFDSWQEYAPWWTKRHVADDGIHISSMAINLADHKIIAGNKKGQVLVDSYKKTQQLLYQLSIHLGKQVSLDTYYDEFSNYSKEKRRYAGDAKKLFVSLLHNSDKIFDRLNQKTLFEGQNVDILKVDFSSNIGIVGSSKAQEIKVFDSETLQPIALLCDRSSWGQSRDFFVATSKNLDLIAVGSGSLIKLFRIGSLISLLKEIKNDLTIEQATVLSNEHGLDRGSLQQYFKKNQLPPTMEVAVTAYAQQNSCILS